jgi:MFS family permease
MLSVFGIVGTGAIADRFGPRRTVSVTFAGSIAGVLILLLMTWFPQQGWLLAYVIVFGLCQGARGPIISSMSTRLFAGRQVASIYGVIYASNAMGAGLGALISPEATAPASWSRYARCCSQCCRSGACRRCAISICASAWRIS